MQRLVYGPVCGPLGRVRLSIPSPACAAPGCERYIIATSEQPRKELRREQRQATTKDNAADLSLGSAFTEHEHQSADHDRDERQRARERTREGQFEIDRSSFPGGLLGAKNGGIAQNNNCNADGVMQDGRESTPPENAQP